MIHKTLAVLVLNSALAALVPATAWAGDRDDRRSSEPRDYRVQQPYVQRQFRDRDDGDRYRSRDNDRDRDHDRDRDRYYSRYSNGYYDGYGYWHEYRR